jgi:hypothetical protein
MGLAQSSPATTTTTAASSADTGDTSLNNVAPKTTLPSLTLSQHHEPYTPPSSPIHPTTHYIFLVHGWLGNDLEMSYLSESLARCIADENDATDHPDAKRMKRSPSQIEANNAAVGDSDAKHPPVVVHSVKCNVGKTHDGIKRGGTRLAHEIVDFIRSDLQKLHAEKDTDELTTSKDDNDQEGHVTYSIVGNSLGGLYARYAISLIPRQVSISRPIHDASCTNSTTTTNNRRIHLHPNTFCTTATPHLGVSQHTYLPIPRIAETIIGSGMGTTGKDLFRLNSDKTGRENVIGANVRRWSGAEGVLGWKLRSSNDVVGNDTNNESSKEEQVDEEMECIIRNMCLQEKYLGPLRHFQKRIAYANAYRTDFQVPTETAAFLNADSKVENKVIACRDVEKLSVGDDGKHEREESSNGVRVPPFVVAIVQTEQQPIESTQSLDSTTPSEELLKMSQSLDALGWTKVFIDVRNRIPLPGIPKPSWRLLPFPSALSSKLPEPDTPLDDLIHSRGYKKDNDASEAAKEVLTVTSSELIQSTNAGETVHFPMGHTVMVANSKSDAYTRLNFQGRPVMDKLAEDMLIDVLQFE